MDDMWRIVKQARLKTTGINHWVYFADDRMFVGIEVRNIEQATIPEQLEPCEFELIRYSKHVHVGPYHALPQKWKALRAELSARGESVVMPSLEVYGHSCEGDDDSGAETTILMGLVPNVPNVAAAISSKTLAGSGMAFSREPTEVLKPAPPV
jgi:hypothetical protein